MNLIYDIWELLVSLRLVDIIFFFAVLILMILIVTLIYFIKINNEEEEEKMETEEIKIAKELRDSMNNSEKRITFTDYEKDQEDKAIISYDELLNKGSKNYELNYETCEMKDDLSVKKVDLDNLVKSTTNNPSSIEVRVISFQKEEAFLEALKRLAKELG